MGRDQDGLTEAQSERAPDDLSVPNSQDIGRYAVPLPVVAHRGRSGVNGVSRDPEDGERTGQYCQLATASRRRLQITPNQTAGLMPARQRPRRFGGRSPAKAPSPSFVNPGAITSSCGPYDLPPKGATSIRSAAPCVGSLQIALTNRWCPKRRPSGNCVGGFEGVIAVPGGGVPRAKKTERQRGGPCQLLVPTHRHRRAREEAGRPERHRRRIVISLSRETESRA